MKPHPCGLEGKCTFLPFLCVCLLVRKEKGAAGAGEFSHTHDDDRVGEE